MRKKYSSEFKAKVAMSALLEQKTLAEYGEKRNFHLFLIKSVFV
jgi:hypothetical protein